ncbi:MAG: flagellin FliC, partial [Candidatus Dadabacteria bacterium]
SKRSNFLIRELNKTSNKLQNIITRLSTGKRINKASDDAASLAIAEALKADTVLADQGSRNLSFGTSMLQIAEGSLSQVQEIDTRLSELAAQSANGTLSDEQRQALQAEADELVAEKGRILGTTEFNGVNVFQGTSLQTSDGTIDVSGVDTSKINTSSFDISTQAAAQASLDSIKQEISDVASMLGDIGADSSRVSIAQQSEESKRVEFSAAESRIRDADIATEVANLVSTQIQQQTQSALLAHNNLTAKSVLDLLK